MRRLLLVATVSLSLLLVLLGVRSFSGAAATQDEILAYEVSHEHSVMTAIHGGVDRLLLTSWLQLDLDANENETYPYSLSFEIFDDQGQPIAKQLYETRSRIHRPVRSDDGTLKFVARLPEGRSLIADPRSAEVDLGALEGRPGMVRITAPPGATHSVLLRLSHRTERSNLEKRIVERTLSSDQQARLIARRSSLGFLDLPDDVRVAALGSWNRRLTALGFEGRDYHSRRLLIGTLDVEAPVSDWQATKSRLGPHQSMVVNAELPIQLWLAGTPGTTVIAGVEGRDSEHQVPATGVLSLDFEGESRVSIELRSSDPAELAVSVDAASSKRVLGLGPRLEYGHRVTVEQDTTRQWVYRLDPQRPVVHALAQGQASVDLHTRILSQEPEGNLLGPGTVRIRFIAPSGALPERAHTFQAAASHYDTTPNALRVSEPRTATLAVPRRAHSLEIRGTSNVVVALDTREPLVEEPRLAEPYASIELPSDAAWSNARYAEKTWARLAPSNESELFAANRSLRLSTPVLIESAQARGRGLEARVLRPLSFGKSRDVFIPTTYSPQYPFPEDGWIALHATRDRERVKRPIGRSSARILFLTHPDRLGETWTVRANDTPIFQERLVLPSGSRIVQLPTEEAWLTSDGLGPGGLLLVQAPPTANRPILKRQRVYSSGDHEPLVFPFERRENESLSALIIVTTRNGNRDVALSYQVDEGLPRTSNAFFLRRATAAQGTASVRTGTRGRALLWEDREDLQGTYLPDRQASLLLPLGDDLAVGPHRLSLEPLTRNASDVNHVWLRVVLVGSIIDELGH